MVTTEQDGTFFTIEAINFLATFFSSTKTRCEILTSQPAFSKRFPTELLSYFLVTQINSRQLVTVLRFVMVLRQEFHEGTLRKYYVTLDQLQNFAKQRDPVTSLSLRALLIWAAHHRGTGDTSKRVHRLARSRYSLGCFRR